MNIFFHESFLMAGPRPAGDDEYAYGRYLTGPMSEEMPAALFGVPAATVKAANLDSDRAALVIAYSQYCDALPDPTLAFTFAEWFLVGVVGVVGVVVVI